MRFASLSPILLHTRASLPTLSAPLLPGTLSLAESSRGLYEIHSCTHASPERIIVVVTGNPGLPSFYAGFAASLAESLKAEVAIVGLANHISWPSVVAYKQGRRRKWFGSERWRSLYALDDQLDHLQTAVEPYARDAASRNLPLVLCGHSIGAWLVVQLLAAAASKRSSELYSPERLQSVLLLMPFLENNMADPKFKSKHDALIRFGRWLIPVIARAAGSLRRAPASLRRKLLASQVGGMDAEYVSLVEDGMLHKGTIHNYLYLARTEMRRLAPSFESMPSELSGLVDAGRVRALYVDEGDEWAPVSMERRLSAMGVRTTVISHEEARHAFSCNASDTKSVSAWVAGELRV